MTWYLVAWISWTCPGGFLSGLWPAAVRPMLCQPKPESRVVSGPREARGLVAPGARLYQCGGLKCRELSVVWSSVVKIEEDR